MSLLEIDSVNFSYGTLKILSDIYLKVEKGEVVGFLGRNGCGKSTLLKVIFGSLKGESQSIRIDGHYHLTPFTSQKIMLVPQDGLFPGFMKPRQAAELYESNIDKLKKEEVFRDNSEKRFDQMSGGVSKYLEMLIVIFSKADFILLDEPFSFLAPVLTERFIDLLKEVSKEKGILLTDHQYESILTVSDRLYLLKDRSIHSVNNRQELVDLGYIR